VSEVHRNIRLRIRSYGRLLRTRYELVGSVKVGGLLDRSSGHQLLGKNCDLQMLLFCKGDGGKQFTEIKKMNENTHIRFNY